MHFKIPFPLLMFDTKKNFVFTAGLENCWGRFE